MFSCAACWHNTHASDVHVDTAGEHSCWWDRWRQHQAHTRTHLDHYSPLPGLFVCICHFSINCCSVSVFILTFWLAYYSLYLVHGLIHMCTLHLD